MADFDALIDREWLLAFGDGGYASATWSGIGSRSYHGLLVASFPPPLGRRLLLAHVDDVFVAADGTRHELATHLYEPGVLHPRGDLVLRSFSAEPWPTWVLEAGDTTIERRVRPATGASGVAVTWRILDGAPGRIELRPFPAARSFHGVGPLSRGDVTASGGVWTWTPEPPAERVPVSFAFEGDLVPSPLVHRRFLRAEERRRGLAAVEDLFSFGIFARDLDAVGDEARLTCWPGERDRPIFPAEPAPAQDLEERLRRAVLACVVREPGSATEGVLAGYPWFNEWGRDTMIALPGVALASGDAVRAQRMLSAWGARVADGLLPNRLREAESADLYNSADAALWFGVAARRLLAAGGDRDLFLREHLPPLAEIVARFREGTRFGIGLRPDDLLHAGEPGVQLTWMDAKIGDRVITPRAGAPVELQALFFDAAHLSASAHEVLGDHARAAADRHAADRLAQAFGPAFWSEERGHLADVVGADRDPACRPNQLLALGGGRALVRGRRGRLALAACERLLLTPFGLRTLDPQDPRYRGRHEGGPAERDASYHQGTVWPWLLGPWADAVLAQCGGGSSVRKRLYDQVATCGRDLDQLGLGHVSEIHDGDAPHRPRGAIAQAWSAAELFRVLAAARGRDLDPVDSVPQVESDPG